jgi:hypothetical protein
MNKVTTCCKHYHYATLKGVITGYLCGKCDKKCTLEDTPTVDNILKDLDKQALAQSEIVEIPAHAESWEVKMREMLRSYSIKNENDVKPFIDFIKSELKQRDKEWGEAIQELNKNLFKNNGK